MKKIMKIILVAIVMVIGMNNVNGQTTITPVDGGTSTSRYAVMTEVAGNAYSLYQHIYDKTLITQGGSITSIQFEHNGAGGAATNMKIYIGETAKSSFTSTTDWVNSGLTLVYSGTITTANSWYSVTLSTPFCYTGSNNLIIVVQRINGTYTSSAAHYYAAAATANVTLYNYSSSTLGTYGSWSSTGYTRQQILPSLKLTFAATPTAPTLNTATPANGTTICAGYNSGTVTTNAGTGGSGSASDEYQYSINNGSSYSSYTPGNTITTTGATGNVIVQSRRIDGGCGCAWSTICTWPIASSPSAPTLSSACPANGSTIIAGNTDGSVTATGGSSGSDGAANEYQYSINGGTSYSSYTSGTAINTTGATGSVIVQARRTGGSYGCSATSWNTICTWMVGSSQTIAINNTVTADGGADWTVVSGNTTRLTKTICVAGLQNPLTDGAMELVQVNLHLGDIAVGTTRNFSYYTVTLTDPSNTRTITLISGNPNSPWTYPNSAVRAFDSKFRDNSYLKYPSNGLGGSAYPWHIAYYRTVTADDFSTFNGIDPNGNWTLTITEASTDVGAKFNDVSLYFAAPIIIEDKTALTTNDACSDPMCIESGKMTIATNNGYTPGANDLVNGDPFPSGTCSWNAAKNNSAWYKFKATASNVSIYFAGLSDQLQVLGVANSGSTCTKTDFTLLSGGCPTDPTNDTYPTPVYSNGSKDNMQLKLTSLTPGTTYYLVVDGTGGAISPIYIEAINCDVCPNTLPVELISFESKCTPEKNTITWSTASEANNDYFIVEKSYDAQTWSTLYMLKGSGNSNEVKNYSVDDNKPPYDGKYYRLTQVDYDGRKETFGPIFSNCIESNNQPTIKFSTKQYEDIINVSLFNLRGGIVSVNVFDMMGRTVYNNSYLIDGKETLKVYLSNLDNGFYIINFSSDEIIKSQKFVKF